MTTATVRPMRGLWRDRHPADVPIGALQRAENVVFRERGKLSPIEAPRVFSNTDAYASDVHSVLTVNKIVDVGEHALIVYQQGNADVGNLARTDEATIADGTHYHHGTWVVNGRATVDGRVVIITEAVDVADGSPYTIEVGNHYHYGRWTVDDRVTLDGRVVIVLDETALIWASDPYRTVVELPDEPISYEAGCMNAVVYRDRLYFTSRQGLICVEGVDDVTPSAARRAGLPAPMIDLAGLISVTDVSGPLEPGNLARTVAVFRRDLPDGSFMRSPPSTPVERENILASNRCYRHNVDWTEGTEIEAGDLIEIYRTVQVASGVDAGESYLHAMTHTITAAEVTALTATFDDYIPDAALGEALYTNGGEQGAVSAYFPPPYLRDVVEYGGAMLGIIAREHESVTVSINGGFGSLSTDSMRVYGIGIRVVTGDTSIGSPNITNADTIVGIVAHQRTNDGRFPSGTVVVSASGTTIVMSQAAIANSVATAGSIQDVVWVNGVRYYASSLYQLMASSVGAVAGATPLAGGITLRSSAAVDGAGSNQTTESAQLSWSRHYAYADAMPFTVGATNGQNYYPPLGSLESPTTSKSYPYENRLAWDAGDLPESWPLLNRAFVGSAPLVRLLKIGDAVYCFADDGTVYRISGTVGDYRIDPVFYGYRLLSAPAAASYGDVGYFWSSRGWVRFGDGSLDVVSRDRVGRDLRAEQVKLTPVTSEWSSRSDTPFNWFASCAIDPVNAEAWLRARVVGGDGVTYIYSEQDGEITEYSRIHGLGCVGYTRGCLGGGQLVSGLDSPSVSILSPRDMTGQVAAREPGGLYEGSFCVEFQRVDMGTPDSLKLLDSVVFGMTTEGGQDDDVDVVVSVHGDMDQGDGSADEVTLALSGTPQRFGRAYVVPVGRRSAQSSQYTVRIEREGDSHRLRWSLEHVAMRFEVTVPDSTGARS